MDIDLIPRLTVPRMESAIDDEGIKKSGVREYSEKKRNYETR